MRLGSALAQPPDPAVRLAVLAIVAGAGSAPVTELAALGRSWAEVAADLGFADQAHLTREFTRLAGATPAVVAAYVAGIEHRGVRL